MSQIITKFIQDNAVTGAKMRLGNNETKRARNSTNTADIDLYKLNTSNQFEFQTLPYVNAALALPSADKQLATIEWVKNLIDGKTDVKNAVGYVATTNVTGTFTAGTLGTTASTLVGVVALVVDGKTFGAGDVNATYPMRVALTGQTAGLQNGIYDLIAAGVSSFTLQRSADFDGIYNSSGNEITYGTWFRVTNGTAFQGYEFQLTTADPITLNTTALTFVGYPSTLSLIDGDMIIKTGNTFAVDLATLSGLESTNPGNNAGQLRIKTATASAEKDRTVQIDSSGNVVAKKQWPQTFLLAAGDITNGYVDLSRVAGDSSVNLIYPGAGVQTETIDFTVNYTAGAGSKTRVTFAGGLAVGGASALAAGETITIVYEAFGP